MLNELLAPFDENTEVEPYKKHIDPLPADWRDRLARKPAAQATMAALRDIPRKERDDGFQAAWEAACDAMDNASIPWEYMTFLNDDTGEWELDIEDQHAVAAALTAKWSEDGEKYDVDENGIFTMSTYNPLSQWDWWTIGGRWTGYFQVRPDAPHYLGRPGVFGNPPPTAQGTVPADVCRKGDINAESMLLAKASQAAGWWDEAVAKHPNDRGRLEFMIDAKPNETRDEYILRQVGTIDTILKPYAVLAEGCWRDGGKMGWWGADSGNKDSHESYAEWFKDFWSMLPDETWLAVCDLHI
jgi:hypothetical protein